MAKLRSTKPLSAQTAAHYLTRFKSFSQWLVDDRRAPENLIAHLEGKQITEDDRERERRAFTNEEIERLLLATMSGPVYGGLTGRQRHTLYVIALATAFRAKELASLTPANFHLDALRPFVAVRASNTKNRRVAEQPLPDELVPVIRECLEGLNPDVGIWNGPRGGNFAKNHRGAMLIRFDLGRAREAWLEEVTGTERTAREADGFLAYENEDGFGDFHALRHTGITRGDRSGLSPKTLQRFARHSTIKLTMDRYCHVPSGDLSASISKIPPLPGAGGQPSVLKATGTEGANRQAAVAGRVQESVTSGQAKSPVITRARSPRSIPVLPDAQDDDDKPPGKTGNTRLITDVERRGRDSRRPLFATSCLCPTWSPSRFGVRVWPSLVGSRHSPLLPVVESADRDKSGTSIGLGIPPLAVGSW